MEDTLLKKLLASIVLALGFSVFAALTHQNKSSLHKTEHKTEEKDKKKASKDKAEKLQQSKNLFKLSLRIHNKIM